MNNRKGAVNAYARKGFYVTTESFRLRVKPMVKLVVNNENNSN